MSSKHKSSHSGSHRHHHTSRKEIGYKSIISIVAAFFIMISAASCLVSLSIITGVCNPDQLRKSINESDYYDDKLEQVADRLSKRLESSGLPADIAGEVVNVRLISVDTNRIISNGLHGDGENSVDTTEYEEELSAKIYGYMEEKGIERNDSLDKATDLLIKAAGKEYASELTFPLVKQYGDFQDKYEDMCRINIYVCIGVMVIMLILLLFLHKRKYRGIRYVNYGLLSGSILAIIVNVILHKSMNGAIKNDDSIYYNIIHNCINQAYTQGFYICLGGLLLFVLMCCMTLYLRKEAI